MGEKEGGFGAYDSLPIPTYEEAISRPSSSQSFLGPAEVSHDAEREGLLRQTGHQYNGYQPPTVESARSSLDFLPSSPEISPREESEGLQREMEQMEILDPLAGRLHQAPRGNRLSKHITSLKHSLSYTSSLPAMATIFQNHSCSNTFSGPRAEDQLDNTQPHFRPCTRCDTDMVTVRV